MVFGIRHLKSGRRAAKPSLTPYVQNFYRIEVKYIYFKKEFTKGYLERFFQIFFFRYCMAWLKITDIDSSTFCPVCNYFT